MFFCFLLFQLGNSIVLLNVMCIKIDIENSELFGHRMTTAVSVSKS